MTTLTIHTCGDAIVALSDAADHALAAARDAHAIALADYRRAIAGLAPDANDSPESAAIYRDVERLGDVIRAAERLTWLVAEVA